MPYTITREDAERDLRALRGVLSGFPVGVSSSAVPAIRELIDSIEEQLKPAFEEPEAFGSLIRARTPQENDQVAADLWQMSPAHGKHYWMSQSGVLEVWSELTDVEVLRVGLGEPARDGFCSCFSSTEQALDCGIAEHRKAARVRRDPMDDGESSDLEKVREEAWNDGAREMAAQVHVKLRALLADAISAERKNAYEKAMQAVEEVTP